MKLSLIEKGDNQLEIVSLNADTRNINLNIRNYSSLLLRSTITGKAEDLVDDMEALNDIDDSVPSQHIRSIMEKIGDRNNLNLIVKH